MLLVSTHPNPSLLEMEGQWSKLDFAILVDKIRFTQCLKLKVARCPHRFPPRLPTALSLAQRF